MVIALISSLAFALAFGPHVQMTLQVVQDEAAIPADTSAPIVDVQPDEFDVSPVNRNSAPVTDTAAVPFEAMEETVITPQEIADPIPQDREAAAEAPESDRQAADTQAGAVAEADWPAILSEVSSALAAAQTASGEFVQTNSDGSISTGSFALNRPGRIRFDYDDPTPILIVSDGTTVAMQDRELETVDRVPLRSTPLGLILSTQLDVDQDTEVLGIQQNADQFGIRVSDATGELEGTLTMVFDKATLDLLGWLTVDGNLQTTVVDLVNVKTNQRIDPRLFRLNEDDEEDDER